MLIPKVGRAFRLRPARCQVTGKCGRPGAAVWSRLAGRPACRHGAGSQGKGASEGGNAELGFEVVAF